MPETVVQPRPAPTADDLCESVDHMVCVVCSPDEWVIPQIALCGEKCYEMRDEPTHPLCPMCADIYPTHPHTEDG